jgi:hypothetical protein
MRRQGAKYYRYIEPVNSRPPVNSALFAFEYKGFLITREGFEHLLWVIQTLEHGNPPPSLRGSFTTKLLAQTRVDDFWVIEERNKETAALANKANNQP